MGSCINNDFALIVSECPQVNKGNGTKMRQSREYRAVDKEDVHRAVLRGQGGLNVAIYTESTKAVRPQATMTQ